MYARNIQNKWQLMGKWEIMGNYTHLKYKVLCMTAAYQDKRQSVV